MANDFSGYGDISPAASKMFQNIFANPSLSSGSKQALLNDYFSEVGSVSEAIAKQKEQSINQEMNLVNLDRARVLLDATRAERQQRELNLTNYGRVKSKLSTILSDTAATPQQKYQEIAKAAVDSDAAADDNTSKLIDYSLKALGVGSRREEKDPALTQWDDWSKAAQVKFNEDVAGRKTNTLDIGSEANITSYIGKYHPEKLKTFQQEKSTDKKLKLFNTLTPKTESISISSLLD